MPLQFQAAALEKSLTNSLGLYIHIPFCENKCNYCSFYSFKPSGLQKEKYVQALCTEIKKWGVRNARPINSIYIGGGTPSLLEEKQLESLFSSISENFEITDDCEITCEVNPNSANDFLEYASRLGVNRVSLGIQSANDNELKTLSRLHTFYDAKATISRAKSLGILNISVDIMLGLPDSSLKSLENSVKSILRLNPNHVSAYILKVEEGTPFGKLGDSLNLPSDDEVCKQYLFLCDLLEKNGYNHYEISNFALDGFESRHNNKYWLCEEYIGIGPSAHSFYEGNRFYYSNSLADFLEGKEPVFDSVGGDEEEFIMLRLRLARGLVFKEFKDTFGKDLSEDFFKTAKLLQKNGLVNLSDNKISLTNKGMLVSNSIISKLIYSVV
ncbi:MAG: radical SAM family heme chaperone HemW [Clostridia bacterium]|nr:radical SAM family heme chaperone HemW [Clostridia bacterium]